jgi:hypothetical protein
MSTYSLCAACDGILMGEGQRRNSDGKLCHPECLHGETPYDPLTVTRAACTCGRPPWINDYCDTCMGEMTDRDIIIEIQRRLMQLDADVRKHTDPAAWDSTAIINIPDEISDILVFIEDVLHPDRPIAQGTSK